MSDPPTGKVSGIVIDATDIGPFIEFWKTILDLDEKVRYPGFVWLSGVTTGGPTLAFQQVPEGKQSKNRLHLDVVCEDRDAFAARIGELGGLKLDEHTIGSFTWFVMADPAGNEFCILESGSRVAG